MNSKLAVKQNCLEILAIAEGAFFYHRNSVRKYHARESDTLVERGFANGSDTVAQPRGLQRKTFPEQSFFERSDAVWEGNAPEGGAGQKCELADARAVGWQNDSRRCGALREESTWNALKFRTTGEVNRKKVVHGCVQCWRWIELIEG